MVRVIIGRFRGLHGTGKVNGASKVSGAAYQVVLSRILNEFIHGYPGPPFFIEVEGQDPSPFLLSALQEEYGDDRVKPVSASRETTACRSRQRPNGTVTLEGGYFCGPLCARRNAYTLSRVGNGWKVTDDRMLWIS